ncbi:MAG: hypothetical protein ACXABO_15235 [Promethearchaeota archaeon]|jgi:hypothetical protein
MMREVQDRVNKVEIALKIFETFVRKFGHQIAPKPLSYLTNQINLYKRELKLRKDYPS